MKVRLFYRVVRGGPVKSVLCDSLDEAVNHMKVCPDLPYVSFGFGNIEDADAAYYELSLNHDWALYPLDDDGEQVGYFELVMRNA
jgi:hypothetical protein